ncbi:MAG TPA: PASTA domain-containing protein [Candidatus Babeliales bacterium]|jgi:beta-lactam-binding protein with PASTA domain|nr:PASTA domain-containing protein [Candidatus Babeliales bacterium]
MLSINIKKYLWIMPFLSFLLGYCIMQRLFRTTESITPHLVGKQVHEILPLITQHNLNIRLIDHKEEADLPEGIILNQTPAAGTAIKPNQPLFLVTTKKPLAVRAPQCIGIKLDELMPQLHTEGIRPRIYHLPHSYPEKICFAQSPQPHEPLEKNRLILYVSSGDNKPIIWPDLTGFPLQNVVEFLEMYQIEPHIINDSPHKQYTHTHYTVTDQRPFAGTLLTLDEHKPLSVQLRVQ